MDNTTAPPTSEYLLRELNMIEQIFRSQFMAETDIGSDFSLPVIYNNGRYVHDIFITSNLKLLEIQKYEENYSQRFETTNNLTLLENELKEIYLKAESIYNFYGKYLSENSKEHKLFLKQKPPLVQPGDYGRGLYVGDILRKKPHYLEQKLNNIWDFNAYHTTIVETKNFIPYNIYFGKEFNQETVIASDNLKISNYGLADICFRILTFIEKFKFSFTTSPNFLQVHNEYIKTEELQSVLPYKLHFKKFTDPVRLSRFLRSSNYRLEYVIKRLSGEQKEKLKMTYLEYLKELKFAQTEDLFKKSIQEYIEILTRLYETEEEILISLEESGEWEEFKNLLWFRVGVKFATGEVKKFPYPEYSAPRIAKALDLVKGEKYILASINGYKSDKNIYASRMKMQTIIDYCQKNNISIDPNFISKLPIE